MEIYNVHVNSLRLSLSLSVCVCVCVSMYELYNLPNPVPKIGGWKYIFWRTCLIAKQSELGQNWRLAAFRCGPQKCNSLQPCNVGRPTHTHTHTNTHTHTHTYVEMDKYLSTHSYICTCHWPRKGGSTFDWCACMEMCTHAYHYSSVRQWTSDFSSLSLSCSN